MTENNLENRVSHLETKVSVIETKIDMFIDEMRDRDNRRAAEISELRKKQEADVNYPRLKMRACPYHKLSLQLAKFKR